MNFVNIFRLLHFYIRKLFFEKMKFLLDVSYKVCINYFSYNVLRQMRAFFYVRSRNGISRSLLRSYD